MNAHHWAVKFLELDKAAVPRPWCWYKDELYGPACEQRDRDQEYDDDASNNPSPVATRIIETDAGYYPPREAERKLIALYRNRGPELARAYLELEERVKKLEAAQWAGSGKTAREAIESALSDVFTAKYPRLIPDTSCGTGGSYRPTPAESLAAAGLDEDAPGVVRG